jgi:hypothetical protein
VAWLPCTRGLPYDEWPAEQRANVPRWWAEWDRHIMRTPRRLEEPDRASMQNGDEVDDE